MRPALMLGNCADTYESKSYSYITTHSGQCCKARTQGTSQTWKCRRLSWGSCHGCDLLGEAGPPEEERDDGGAVHLAEESAIWKDAEMQDRWAVRKEDECVWRVESERMGPKIRLWPSGFPHTYFLHTEKFHWDIFLLFYVSFRFYPLST